MAKISKILIIEDDAFISDLYSRSLRKAGYTVDTVVTGPQGIIMAKSGNYDLILLDIMIPDLTGIDVLKELRGSDGKGLASTKIVITTNLNQDDTSRTELEKQADGYLIKADVTPHKLLDIIKQLEQFGEVPEQEPEGP